MPQWVHVALDVPLPGPFTYALTGSEVPAIGTRVIVPFGRRTEVGLVVDYTDKPDLAPDKIKPITRVLEDLPPLSSEYLDYMRFMAQYYHHGLGEALLPSFPPQLRTASKYTGPRSSEGPVVALDKKWEKAAKKAAERPAKPLSEASGYVPPYTLNAEQQEAVGRIRGALGRFEVFLLFGVTGSGKTAVYLDVARQVLQAGQQVLFLVPEINLTPQFEQLIRTQFADVLDEETCVVLHSGLTPAQRLAAWVRIQRGQARFVVGTRMASFAPLVNPGLIIVDEEHDPSYKQSERLRASSRDMQVWRARQRGIPVVLGSATPSLSTWHAAQTGRYTTLYLRERATRQALAPVELIDTRGLPLDSGLSLSVLSAMDHTIKQGKQVMVYLNRRGFAPVLFCDQCHWTFECPHCSVMSVLHRRTKGFSNVMKCHHCGGVEPVPTQCAKCGNQELTTLGQGTQQVEDLLRARYGEDRVMRIDADAAKSATQAHALFDVVHQHGVDVVVGTQMVSKGHDFKHLGLVVIVGADNKLYSSDFRASEVLFAQLMQVAGRAGRHEAGARVLIQTQTPQHPVYQYLTRHDFEGFAAQELQDRKALGLPPFAYQCLVTAQHKYLASALAFLTQLKDGGQSLMQTLASTAHPLNDVLLYDPIELPIVRVNNIERAQMLIESPNRQHLHQFLAQWLPWAQTLAKKARVSFAFDIDPWSV